MPLPADIRTAVDQYARNDLPGDLAAHIGFFDFLHRDPELQRRVGEEYFTARYIYKFFEGMRIEEDWARRAQIQLQVQQYASIYEACLHHLLFALAGAAPVTRELLEIETFKQWSVPGDLQKRLAELHRPDDEREVVAAIRCKIPISDTKVRFEYKAKAAAAIGIINEGLATELTQFYKARNMIHIHAELKQGADWSWEIEFARQAYWRLLKFAQQARAWLGNTEALRK